MQQQNLHYEELTRVFRISLYGLVMLAGLILGSAEGSWLPFGTFFLAGLGYWATEFPGNNAISNRFSNVLGMIAILFTALEFFSNNPEGKLLSGTHLVVYSAWIVFFQKSTVRKYWLICVLSVLQVAVAAVLTSQSWYGTSLVVFALATIWTLSVFSLYYAMEQYRELSLAPALVTGGTYRFTSATSEAGHEIQLDSHGRWITLRFISGVGFLAVLALMMSCVFYVLTPRVWVGQRLSFSDLADDPGLGRRNTTGFTPHVKLGDMGELLESMAPVMTVQVTDVRRGQSRKLTGDELSNLLGYNEPMFFGGVMVNYRRGLWEADTAGDFTQVLRKFARQADLREEINLQPVAGNLLFYMGSPIACEFSSSHLLRAERGRLSGVLRHQRSRNLDDSTGAITYINHSRIPALPPDGIPRHQITLEESKEKHPLHDAGVLNYLQQCLQLPRNSLARLQALAQSIQDQETEKRGREPTPAELANRMESYLRDSEEYQYSLKLSIQDSSIDPVEDFLFNRKVGHCEYFATALALMLRSVNIPSRLINGFKGGEMNYRGQLEVQQRHAHTWVEAFDGENAWMVLDPTPGAREKQVKEIGETISFTQKMSNFFNGFWLDWVTNFNSEKQRDTLYRPLSDYFKKLWALTVGALVDGPALWNWFWQFITNPKQWFSQTGLIFVVVITGVLFSIRWLFRKLRGWWQRMHAQRSVAVQSQILVPFYARFVRFLSSRGTVRPSAQTPAEFARQVASQASPSAASAELARVPDFITQLYYQVRYGNKTISAEESARIDQTLDHLEQVWK